MALIKQTAIVASLETPVRNWVDEDVMFYDEYDTNVLRYWSHLLCHDTYRTGLLSQSKKIADPRLSLRSAMSSYFLHMFNTCLN